MELTPVSKRLMVAPRNPTVYSVSACHREMTCKRSDASARRYALCDPEHGSPRCSTVKLAEPSSSSKGILKPGDGAEKLAKARFRERVGIANELPSLPRGCVRWRPPAVREGRMDLRKCRISPQDMDHILECIATGAEQRPSHGDGCSSSDYMRAMVTSQHNPNDSTVRSLNLGDKNLQFREALLLAHALMRNTSLKALDLSSNGIGDQGASALSEVLRANASLETLNLASNGISQEGLVCLSVGLRNNITLKSLELSFNGCGHRACVALFDAVAESSAVEYLGLGFNGIMSLRATPLSRCIMMSRSLKELELSYNALGDSGASEIAAALRHASGLQTLGLVSNGITDDGAKALAASLASNQSLLVLGLSSNLIGDAGATAFAAALRNNNTMRGLYLEENDLTEAGERELASARENTSSCKSIAPEFQLAVMMGLHRRIGASSPLSALDICICREILGMCDTRRSRDVLFYPKIVGQPVALYEEPLMIV